MSPLTLSPVLAFAAPPCPPQPNSGSAEAISEGDGLGTRNLGLGFRRIRVVQAKVLESKEEHTLGKGSGSRFSDYEADFSAGVSLFRRLPTPQLSKAGTLLLGFPGGDGDRVMGTG